MEAEASHAPHDHAATVRAAAAAERVVFLTLIVGAAAISIGINLWKRWHLRSFQLVSLVALWLLPAINGVYSGWSRFLVAWTAYTAATAYILWTASRKPLARETPKRVYRYLSLMYTCCSYACVGAYVIFTAMLIFAPQGNRHRQPRRHLHISPPEHEGEQPRISIHNGAVHVEGGDDSLAPMPPPPPPPVPGETLPSVVVDYLFSAMFYGLFFSVVTRDVAELAASMINSALGYFKKDDDDHVAAAASGSDGHEGHDVPQNICALCGTDLLTDAAVAVASAAKATPLGASAGRMSAGEGGSASASGGDGSSSGTSSSRAQASGATMGPRRVGGGGRSRASGASEVQLSRIGRRRKADDSDDEGSGSGAAASSGSGAAPAAAGALVASAAPPPPGGAPGPAAMVPPKPVPVFEDLEDVDVEGGGGFAGGGGGAGGHHHHFYEGDEEEDDDDDEDGFFTAEEAALRRAALANRMGMPYGLDLSGWRRLLMLRQPAAADDGRPRIQVATTGGPGSSGTGDHIFKLPCGHTYHSVCIKGWTLVGKKNSCPSCNQRVDLGLIAGRTIWGKPSILWAHLLSAVRWLVVWMPLLYVLIQFALFESGIDMNKIAKEEIEAHRAPGAPHAPAGHAHENGHA